MLNVNQEFNPSFCPNPECRFHPDRIKPQKWFVKHSFYFNKKQNKICRRFMCLGCKKTFGLNVYAFDYCLKLDLSHEKLFGTLKKGMNLSQWAKALGHGTGVIENRLFRLGRWLVFKGKLSEKKLLSAKKQGLPGFGLLLKRLWKAALSPERDTMARCFLKQLNNIGNLAAKRIWGLLSWRYRLNKVCFYQPVFTFH